MKILLATIAIFLLHFVHPVFCRLADVDHWLHPDSTGEIQSCLSPELADQERDTCRFFAIVIDAGSTGTRLHLYEFSHDPNSDSTPFHVEKETFREVKPGLSSFAEDPEGAARSFGDLLIHAENSIPKSLWRHTPITMKATAGLRLLSKELAEAILEHVQYRISLTEFLLDEQDAVGVLSGTDEGVFGWFTLNVLLQRMDRILPHQSNCQQRIIKDIEMPGIIPHPSNCQQRIIKDIEMNDRTTAAALDLGGGSTQITFMPIEPQRTFNGIPMEDFTHNISLFGHLVHLYTHSYLGNGLIAARLAIAKRDSVSSTLLHTVCMPEDFIIETWDYAGILWTVRGSREYGLNGCLEAAVEFVHKSQVRAVEELDDISIYAFSYFFDRGLQAGLVKNNMGGLTTIEAFRNAAERARQTPSEYGGFMGPGGILSPAEFISPS